MQCLQACHVPAPTSSAGQVTMYDMMRGVGRKVRPSQMWWVQLSKPAGLPHASSSGQHNSLRVKSGRQKVA